MPPIAPFAVFVVAFYGLLALGAYIEYLASTRSECHATKALLERLRRPTPTGPDVVNLIQVHSRPYVP